MKQSSRSMPVKKRCPSCKGTGWIKTGIGKKLGLKCFACKKGYVYVK